MGLDYDMDGREWARNVVSCWGLGWGGAGASMSMVDYVNLLPMLHFSHKVIAFFV